MGSCVYSLDGNFYHKTGTHITEASKLLKKFTENLKFKQKELRNFTNPLS